MKPSFSPLIPIAIIVLFGVSTITPNSVVLASAKYDFGDAPDGGDTNYLTSSSDGSFPALLASDGGRTSKIKQVWLGKKVNREKDSRQVDRDKYDDGVSTNLSACAESEITVLIHIPKKGMKGTAYLNAYFDWDHNGTWEGEDNCAREWVLRNVPIDLGDQETAIAAYTVKFTAGAEVKELWYRVMVTRNQRVVSASGSGTYKSGEVEDYGPEALETEKDKEKKKKKRKKFGAECKPNPLVMTHGKSGKFRIVKKAGSVAITSTALANSVTPNTPWRKVSKSGSATFRYRSKKKDPPQRVVTETVPIRVRFGAVASIVVKCRVFVVHDAIQEIIPLTHDIPIPDITGSVARVTDSSSPGFRIELTSLPQEIVDLQIYGFDLPIVNQHPDLPTAVSLQLDVNGQGWPEDWQCALNESGTAKQCLGQTTPLMGPDVKSTFDMYFGADFTEPNALHLHLLDAEGNVAAAADLPFQRP